MIEQNSLDVRPPVRKIRHGFSCRRGSKLDRSMKRLLDILIALSVIALFSPLFVMIAVSVRFLTGAPPIYKHRRVGQNGLPFECYKFQSMYPNSDKVLQAHLAEDPEAALEWLTSRKLRRDPRVTEIGRLLRATSLDEIPQFFNVLRGDMSCVGPRPITFAELERYGTSARLYLTVRPGLTGLWQVSGRSDLSYSDRVALDRQYVLNRTLLVDLFIVLRTIPAVIRVTQTS